MASSLDNIKIGCWVYILLFWLAATIFLGAAPTLQTFEYTYLLPPAHPGALTSSRWTFYYWTVALFVLLWVVPITLAFAIEDTEGHPTEDSNATGKGDGVIFRRLVFHLIVTALLTLWYVAVFIYYMTLWANANTTTPSNFQNPANDPRFCCVYYNLDPHCTNTAPCDPGVSADMLVTNQVFLYTMWFGFIFIVALLVDLLLVMCLVLPSYRAHALGEGKRSSSASASAVGKRVSAIKGGAYNERLLL